MVSGWQCSRNACSPDTIVRITNVAHLTHCSNTLTLFPIYASYQAIDTGDAIATQKWLAYWVVITGFSVLETLGDRFVSWLPLYWELKIALVLWLTLWGGATTLYDGWVGHYLARYEPEIDKHLEIASSQVGTVIESVGRRVAEHAKTRGAGLLIAATQLLQSVSEPAIRAPAAGGNGLPAIAASAAAPGPVAASAAAARADSRRATTPR